MPPESTWPLINYEYLVLLLPPLMVGTLVGGLGNAVSPGWFRVVLLISMQVVVLYRSVKKAIAQREKDRAAAHSVIVHEYSSYFFVNGKPEVDPEDVRGSRGYASMAVRRTLVLNNEGEYTSTLDDKEAPQKCCSLVPHQYHYGNYFRDYKPQYPWRLMLIALFVFSITLAFVAASSNTLNIVECNCVGYWLILVGAIAFAIVAVATIRAYLAYLNCLAAICDVHCNVVPFRWNKFTTVGFPMFAFIAGAAASMLGSGSGMILNFVLLEADLLPEEVSATGGVATTLVAAQAVIVFILQGNLSWDFGLYVIAAGIVSALIGQFCLIRPIKKRGLTFLFIVSLVVIMVCSLGSLTAYGIYETIEIVSVGGSLMFGSLCD